MIMDITSWMDGKPSDTVLIVLNQLIVNKYLFDKAWDACAHHVVADGAANELVKLNNSKYVPDFLIGDGDSISKASQDHYLAIGVPFVSKKSQEATDFMKSMTESHERFGENLSFLAFGSVGGRLDHSWHSFLCLSIAAKAGDTLLLISNRNITLGLQKGTYEIGTPQSKLGPAAGYAPLDGKCCVTTKGLMYDVENMDFSFTTRVSTSNYLASDEVSITTDSMIMFTVEFKEPH